VRSAIKTGKQDELAIIDPRTLTKVSTHYRAEHGIKRQRWQDFNRGQKILDFGRVVRVFGSQFLVNDTGCEHFWEKPHRKLP
jgi:hypothetical protein